MKWIAQDKWLSWDKLKHLSVCFVLTMIFYKFWYAGLLVFGIGIAKELYGLFRGGKFSYKDIVANCIGIGFALLLRLVII